MMYYVCTSAVRTSGYFFISIIIGGLPSFLNPLATLTVPLNPHDQSSLTNRNLVMYITHTCHIIHHGLHFHHQLSSHLVLLGLAHTNFLLSAFLPALSSPSLACPASILASVLSTMAIMASNCQLSVCGITRLLFLIDGLLGGIGLAVGGVS